MSTITFPSSIPAPPGYFGPLLTATELAGRVHQDQKYRYVEPVNVTPYIAHPMVVAGMVYQYGGTHAAAIAAVLHDVVEDQAKWFKGRQQALTYIAKVFGQEVADIVEEVSDPEIDDPTERKRIIYNRVGYEYSPSAWLVKGADFLNTLNAVAAIVVSMGPNAAFQGFLALNDETLPITQQIQIWTKNNDLLYNALDFSNNRLKRENPIEPIRKAGYRDALLLAIKSELNRLNALLVKTEAYHRDSYDGSDWRDNVHFKGISLLC